MVNWTTTDQSLGEGTYALASWLFLRLIGLIYFAAFTSLATQVLGLIGSAGILPAEKFLTPRKSRIAAKYHQLPTLCWISATDRSLLLLSWGGAILSLALFAGFAPKVVLISLWVFYLSLFNVARIFLGYQWDILLLETGFIAIFLSPAEWLPHFPPAIGPSFIPRLLLWWVLFRVMFSSGVAKLRSTDPTWRNLSALCHHYETQPLPSRVAWHAHLLSSQFHRACAAAMFFIEVLAPLLIFTTRESRHVAAFLFILLMVLIQLSGNYGFFNLLGIALSVMLFDDRLLLPLFGLFSPQIQLPARGPPLISELIALPVAILLLTLSLLPVVRLFRFEIKWWKPLAKLFEFFEPFHLVNSYGLFSVMTTERPEIIIEGSIDGITWKAYEFKWKPGDVSRAPAFIAPHQPRLDWQMWFAALGYYSNNDWFRNFLVRLLEGSPNVVRLLEENPFAYVSPKFVRAVLYDYKFTMKQERAQTGAWWKRERRGMYSPILSLDGAQNVSQRPGSI